MLGACRPNFFGLADIAAQLKRRKGAAVISPIAAEAVKLGVEQAVIEELAETMRLKDGSPSVIDSAVVDDPSIDAITADGIDYSEECSPSRLVRNRACPHRMLTHDAGPTVLVADGKQLRVQAALGGTSPF